MDREELAGLYVDAWNQRDAKELSKIMHPQASFHDTFWGETFSGSDLLKYFNTNLAADNYWYRSVGELIITPDAVINRYVAFESNDPEGLVPIYKGAEVVTVSNGLIMTITDFYCDPNPVELKEIAKLVEKRHGQSNIAPLGLSNKTSSRIKRRLAELAKDMTFFLEPSLTVTQLADRIGCSVMHLFHVLEEEKETTFLKLINEIRARYASTLLVDVASVDIRFDRIAERSGFESVEEFRNAFQSTFGISADDYVESFSKKKSH